jgi:dynein heavy chain
MWRSLRDWKIYTDKQLATAFIAVDAPSVKIEAEKYAKIVNRLEKTLEDNPIQRSLKEQVETFRGAMPIVTALRRTELKSQHWVEINELIGAELQVDEEGFSLQSLIDMNVVPF